MQNEQLTGNGSGPRAVAGTRADVFRKALSVLLSVLLVVTMSPLSGDASAIARAAEGVGSASAADADGAAQSTDQNTPDGENLGGGSFLLG